MYPSYLEVEVLNDEILNHRSSVTISNINQFIYSSIDGDVSFRGIWNHILLMLQHPLSFFLYRKDIKTNEYDHFYTLNRDPLSIGRFEELKNNWLRGADVENYSFPLVANGGYEYYIVLISAYNITAIGSQLRSLELVPNDCSKISSSNDSYLKFLIPVCKQASNFFLGSHTLRSKFFDEFLYQSLINLEKDNPRSSEVNGKFLVDSKSNLGSVYKTKMFHDENYSSWRYVDKVSEKLNENEGVNKGYLDRIFENVQSGLDYIQSHDSGSLLPNSLFYLRYYEGKDGFSRCDGNYHYDVELYLNSDQKNSFKRYLGKLKKSDNMTKYSSLSEPSSDYEYNKVILSLLKKADDWFWDCLDVGNYSEIISLWTSPFGKSLRAVADPSFSNGCNHFMYGFLSDGGIPRCFGGRKDSQVREVDEDS